MFDDVVGFDQVTDAKIHPPHFGPRILPLRMSAYCSCNIPGGLGCSRSEVVGRRPPCMVEDGSRRSCRTGIEIPSSLLKSFLHDRPQIKN